MIELKNVSKKFGDFIALENINLKAEKGEVLTIVGPNGSGKTTILRIMAGIEKPTSGEFYFDGEIVTNINLTKIMKNITMVFQKTVLFNTTVEKNIMYGLKLRNISKHEMSLKMRHVLKLVKLEGYEKYNAKKLSGGEQQRVSLARALALDTTVLLMDEPTANLDPKNVSIIEDIISRVNSEFDKTIVMATHNMYQAKKLTKNIVVLIKGKVDQIGDPNKVFGEPSDSLAGFAKLENVFSGVSKLSDYGTSLINLGDIIIEAAERRIGKVDVFIKPQDIILSKEKIVSSARNVFKGYITGISYKQNRVKLNVDIGKKFNVQITKRSFKEMQLNLGSKVFLTFKASIVRMV
jgi:tungstate transport system ATP-binding protein